MRNLHDQHSYSLLDNLKGFLWRASEARTFTAIVALFLDTSVKTTLQNIKTISASTASRFFSFDLLPEEACWEELNGWQLEQFYQSYRQKRGGKPEVVLKIDLTCIEKTGREVPFAWCFNRRYGIQLVTLHACLGGLSFPISQRIYQGKGKATTVDLALELLAQFPASSWPSRVVVLADAGFGDKDFLSAALRLGFKKVIVGIRHNRVLMDGRQLHDLKYRGEAVRLHDLSALQLYLSTVASCYVSWCDVKRDEGKKRFYIVSTFRASGHWLSRRYRKRWLIESFFSSIKHDFGLKEARLRTKDGIKLWIFFSFLAYSLASLERFLEQASTCKTQTLGEAARHVYKRILSEHLLHALMVDCEQFTAPPSYRLRLEAV